MTALVCTAWRRCLGGLSLLMLCWHSAAAQGTAATEPSSDLVLGMYSYRPAEILAARWQPLADYLSQQLPDRQVVLRMLDQTSLSQALARGEIDLLFTNPVHYIRLRERFAMSGALATLMRQARDQPVSRIGGVIFTRAERTDITHLSDLEGKEVLAAGPDFLGGYMTSAYELHSAGIPLDQIRFSFDPASHDEVISAVLDGRGDAGFVRTGIIEQLEAEGRIDPARLRIVHQQPIPGFPMVVSTRLYPEWPIMALPHLDPGVARRLAAALLLLDQDHPIAQEIGIKGFDLPADYSALETVMRELHVAPFDRQSPIDWADLWQIKRLELLAATLAALLFTALLIALAITNLRLRVNKAQISASEQRWLSALDAAGHGVWDWDLSNNRVAYSPRWKQALGYSTDEIGTSIDEWRKRVHPDDLTAAIKARDSHLTGEHQEYSLLHRLRAKDGTYRWSLGQGAVIERDARGRATRMIGTNTDVTGYRELELALTEKETLFSALVSQAPDGMLLIDPTSRRVFDFNRAAHEALGYTVEEFAQLDLSEIEALKSPAEQQAIEQQVLEQGALIFDTRHRCKDGRLRDVRVSARSLTQAGKTYIACVFKDLTDLREAERARQVLHQQLEATFERAAVGMAHLAPDGRFLRANRRVCELLGYSVDVLRTKCFQELTHPDDLPKNLQLMERLLRGETASYRIEKRYFRSDARWVWVLVTTSLVRAPDGAPQYLIVVIEDIAERKRAEERLHVSAQMVEKAAYAFIATDMDGIIRVYNPAAERLLGYPAREMLDRETPLLFHLPQELAARAAELSQQLGEPVEPDFQLFVLSALHDAQDRRQWTLRRRDGQEVIVLLSLTLLSDSQGQSQGILGNLADITPLRQATEALRWERDRAQRYLETVHSLVILLDANGCITLANPYACDLLGYSQDALLGRNWLEVCVRGEEHERLRGLFQRPRQGIEQPLDADPAARECGYLESQVTCADGSQRLIGWHSNLFADEGGRMVGILCAGNDITERHAMELAREAALQESERLAALKSAFLTNMSHEIRTPLHAILGLAQIGRRDFASDDAGPLFRRIQQAGRHLLALLNDVLDVSKMEAGKVAIHSQPFRLADRIAEIKSMIRPSVSVKGLRLRIDCASDLPEWVEGDALRLQQILINLLGNAVKFTAEGEVRLQVFASGDQTVFLVTDTGIGISAEQLTRIFQPFEQVEVSSARAHGGTGLGLAISNNLAQLMGGSLSVESELGRGSTFELRLPLPAVTAPPDADVDSRSDDGNRDDAGILDIEPERLKGLHLLAVDDVDVNLMVIEDLLSHEGARLTTARNGHQALAKVQQCGDDPFDLVLMDVQMPIMDGYEATQRIHSIAPDLPVIGLTAHAFPEERDRCLAAGMCAHLSKPVDIDLLIQTLRFWQRTKDAGDTPAREPIDGHGDQETSLDAEPAPPATAVPDPGAGQIDWAALNRRFAASPGLVTRLASAALHSEAEAPAQLRAIAAAGDLDHFFRKTHAVKGLAANLCAETLRAQAHRCCEQARAGDAAALDHAEALAQSLEALLGELSATMTTAAPTESRAAQPED